MNKTIVAQQAKTVSFLPTAQGLLQRKCACSNHTIASGECAECAKNKSGLQRKLRIGASNDPLELEADRVADQVMAAPSHSAVTTAPPRIQRYAGQVIEGSDTAPASVDRVLASSGRPLEPALQQDMEQRFGHDFSSARVHSGGAAEQSARDVNANAYTVGHNVVFGAGQFTPGTHGGRQLLAHVVQQRVKPAMHEEKPLLLEFSRYEYETEANLITNASVSSTSCDTALPQGLRPVVSINNSYCIQRQASNTTVSFHGCPDPKQPELIKKAVATARRWVYKALTNVWEVLNNIAPKNPSKVFEQTHKNLASQFNIGKEGKDENVLQEVATVYRGLYAIYSGFEGNIPFECETSCDDKISGYVYPRILTIFDDKIHFCPIFFDANALFPQQRIRAVIHEMAHKYAGIWGDTYEGAKEFWRLSPKDAIKNADSYASFVHYENPFDLG
jgi:hypothetical protein